MLRSIAFAQLCLWVLLLAIVAANAQTPAPGIQPFSTQITDDISSVDMSTGSVTLSIPIRSKNGKTPFSYSLIGNAGIVNTDGNFVTAWYTAASAFQSYPGPYFPYLHGVSSGLLGSILAPNSVTTWQCGQNTNGTPYYGTVYGDFVLIDSTGAAHPFPAAIHQLYVGNNGCGPTTFTGTATDGSGYTLVATGGPTFSATIYDKAGNHITTGLWTGGSTVTDPDGVSISYTAGVYPNADTSTISDTLGMTALTLTVNGGPSSDTYSYTDASDTNREYVVSYTSYTLKSNFSCPSNIPNDFDVTGLYLPTGVLTPTGARYAISYEQTPGTTGNITTGRVAKIILPSGGYIKFGYTGGNSGINCNSSVVPTLTKTVYDNNGNTAIWTYVNSNTQIPSEATNFTVTETDPAQNQTVYNFGGEYQTQSAAYQGGCPTTITGCNGGGTLLRTTTTCYNGNFSSCATSGPGSALSITQTDVYTSYNGGANNLVETKFDAYGNIVEVKQYDFGVAMGAAPTVNPISDTLTYYGQSWNSSSGACNAYPTGTYINNTPCYSYTNNSAGTTVAQTQITYSSTGHPTSTAKWTSSSSWLTSTATYNTNGTIATATDANTAVSRYAYNGTGGCSSLLPTSVKVTGPSLPAAGLTNSTQWDCNGGVVTVTTDPNKQTTTTYYEVSGTADPLYRPLSFVDQDGYTTNFYYSPTTFESVLNFNGSVSTVDTLTTSDGIGRQIFSQTRQGQGSSEFDTTQTAYGWTTTTSTKVGGMFTTTSVPYSGTQGQTAPTGTPVTTTQLDALGRTYSVTDGGGGVTSYAYASSGANSDPYFDVQVTLGPSPQGENSKKRQLEYDGLGRLNSVCEITAGTTSWPGGSCAQGTSQTGYWTKYTYDALGDLLSVRENAQGSTVQSRSYGYDGLRRLVLETNPEWGSGTATYHYDSDSSGTCSGSYNGDLVKRVDNAGNITCYQHDGLHRTMQATYVSGPNSAATPNKCFVYDAAIDGNTVTNPLGQLVEAYTTTSACSRTTLPTVITDEAFSYSPRGELANYYQSSPNSGGYYSVPVTYWANGLIESFGPFLTEDQIGYIPDGEGRAGGVNDFTYQSTPVPSISYYNPPGQPTGQPTGNQPTQIQTSCLNGTCYPISYTYDPNTLRMTEYSAALNGGTISGSLTWNPNWSLAQLVVADPFNSADAQTCNYSADDLSRLASVSCVNGSTNVWGQTFSYDAFGNITKSGSSSWIPGYNSSTNQYASGSGATYDANGDLTYDGSNMHYAWDAEGKMLSGTNYQGGVTAFTYDAFGHRVEMSSGGTYSNSFVRLGQYQLSAIGQTPFYSEYPFPGGSMASEYGGLTGVQLGDWLGTSRATWGYTGGSFIESGAHAPFGESYSNDVGYTRDFTGQQTFDNVTYSFPGRYYHSGQGRWLSTDPAGIAAADPTHPQSWNRYAYVLNNPLALTDPDGLDCVYLNDAGNGVESIDHNSNPDECNGVDGSNGGYWVPGTVANSSWVTSIDQNNGTIGAYSNQNGFLGWTASANNDTGVAWQTVGINVPNTNVVGSVYTSQDDLSPSAQRTILAIAAAAPRVCGGGVFGFAGAAGEGPGVGAFHGAIGELDSRSGASGGSLTEITGGEGVILGGGYSTTLSPSQGIVSGQGLVVGGVGIETPLAGGSAGVVGFESGAGVYADVTIGSFEFGGGAYLNITTNAGCK